MAQENKVVQIKMDTLKAVSAREATLPVTKTSIERLLTPYLYESQELRG